MHREPTMLEPHVVAQDCRGLVQLMSDGTVLRSTEPPAPFQADVMADDDCGVEWKDVMWEPEMDLSVRLNRPRHLGAANDARIPVVAYFHGAGAGFFCLGSGRWLGPHAWCLRLAAELHAVVAVTGVTRTRAELACPPDADVVDNYARLFLPDGATKDHPAINLAVPEGPQLGDVLMAPALVVAAERDVLRGRHAHYARRMKEEWGKDVEYAELAGVGHRFLDADPWSERADELVWLVRRFVVQHMDSE